MHFGIAKLENSIRHYDWGSREFIARLQARSTPSELPEAELWIGDHPRAPSRLLGAIEESLPDCIRRAPEVLLGVRSIERFGPTLPFLVKVLAAASPLSIQVHPDAISARRGFEAEERRGVAPCLLGCPLPFKTAFIKGLSITESFPIRPRIRSIAGIRRRDPPLSAFRRAGRRGISVRSTSLCSTATARQES